MPKIHRVPEFEKYGVDRSGNFYSQMRRGDPRWRRVAGSIHKTGYRRVSLRKGGKIKLFFMGPLMLTVFRGPRPDGMDSCHNNGKRDDNRIRNLRWDTRKANHADKAKHGTSQVGEMHGCSILKSSQVAEIKRRYKFRGGADSGSALAKEFGVDKCTICDIVQGRTWKHVKARK
jgi:hypothetical protein